MELINEPQYYTDINQQVELINGQHSFESDEYGLRQKKEDFVFYHTVHIYHRENDRKVVAVRITRIDSISHLPTGKHRMREHMSVLSAMRSAPPRHPPPPIMSASTRGDASRTDTDAVKRSKRTRHKQDGKDRSRGLERGQGGCRACQARTLVSPGICSREEMNEMKNFLWGSCGLSKYFSRCCPMSPRTQNAADFGSGQLPAVPRC